MPDDNDSLLKFKDELRKALEKSQESFEKQLSFISAGAFGLSMLFIEKIIGKVGESKCKWLLIICWILLAGTFLVNLFSHVAATKLHYKTIEEIDSKKYDAEVANDRIKTINYMNFASVVALLLGIALLILFVTINI